MIFGFDGLPIERIRYEDFARNTRASVLAELADTDRERLQSLSVLNWRDARG